MGTRKQFFIHDKSFYKVLIGLAFPVILQNMITIGVNIMDTVMLGSYGEIQLSGSSLANNFIEIFHIMHMGMGGGAAVLIAQYWGQKEIPSIRKVISITMRISLCATLLFSVATALFSEPIMSIYTNDAAVIEKGSLYLLVSIPAYFLSGISLVMTLSLRAMRRVAAPMIASIISFFVNIFFNWVFIFGHLGAPELQIAGAALGTVIARVAEFLIIGYFFLKRNRDVGYKIKDLFMPCGEQVKLFLHYATPVLISDTLLTFGNNALSIIMGHIGTSFVAAFSIVAPVMRLSNVFTSGIGMSASTLTGNIVGEGDREKAQQCGVTCLTLTVICGILAGVVIKLICPFVISLYQITPETQAIAEELMDAAAIMVLFMATQSVLTKGVLRGGGDTRFLMVMDVIFLWVLSVPLGILCGLVWEMSPFIVFIALRADHIVKSVWCGIRLFRGKWIKRIQVGGADTAQA